MITQIPTQDSDGNLLEPDPVYSAEVKQIIQDTLDNIFEIDVD